MSANTNPIIVDNDETLACCNYCDKEYNDHHALKDEYGNDLCPHCLEIGDRSYYQCQHGVWYDSPADDDCHKVGKDRDCLCGSRW